jgi:hypothetical protein
VVKALNNLFKGSVCPFHMYRLLIGDWVETEEKGLALRADDIITNPGISIAYYLRKIPSYQRMLLRLVSGFYTARTAEERYALKYIKQDGLPEFDETAVYAEFCIASQKEVSESMQTAKNNEEDVRNTPIDERK